MAVVLAALGEPPDPALDAALGASRAAALRDLVAGRAHRAVAAVAEVLAFDEPDGEGLTTALADALAGHAGPVLLAGPDVPGLDEDLVRAGLEDLAAGCTVSLAPATDGRAFLLVLRRPSEDLLALVASRAGRRTLADVVAVAAEHAGEVGLLRAERRLVTPADATAVALDPLTDPELRALAAPILDV